MAQSGSPASARLVERAGILRPPIPARSGRYCGYCRKRAGGWHDESDPESGCETGAADRIPQSARRLTAATGCGRLHLPASHLPGIPGGLLPDRPRLPGYAGGFATSRSQSLARGNPARRGKSRTRRGIDHLAAGGCAVLQRGEGPAARFIRGLVRPSGGTGDCGNRRPEPTQRKQPDQSGADQKLAGRHHPKRTVSRHRASGCRLHPGETRRSPTRRWRCSARKDRAARPVMAPHSSRRILDGQR